jgi:microcystin-dependent protein
MPAGQIIPWPVNGALPAGYLWCDGNFYAIALYPDLFAVIGLTYGAGGPGTFRVPDCQIRHIVGAGTAVALAANDGLALGARNVTVHQHIAAGLSGASANLNVTHTLVNSGPPSTNVNVDTGGAINAAGPDHTHTAPPVADHTLGAHQHAAGNTLNLTDWPPYQYMMRIIRTVASHGAGNRRDEVLGRGCGASQLAALQRWWALQRRRLSAALGAHWRGLQHRR